MNKIELLAEFRQVAEHILQLQSQLQSQLQDLEIQVNMQSNYEEDGCGI